MIRESGHPCTLVNASGRIVASTDARRETGSLLRLDGLADALAPLRDAVAVTDAASLPGGEAVCRAATRRSRSCSRRRPSGIAAAPRRAAARAARSAQVVALGERADRLGSGPGGEQPRDERPPRAQVGLVGPRQHRAGVGAVEQRGDLERELRGVGVGIDLARLDRVADETLT